MSVDTALSSSRRYWPLGQLVLARVREFVREPEALFWVYGFPILMTVGLGIAFQNKPIERIAVAIVEGSDAEATAAALASSEGRSRFETEVVSAEEARRPFDLARGPLLRPLSAHCSMSATNRRVSIGFEMYPTNPSASSRSRSPLIACAVKATNGTVSHPGRCRSTRMSATPSISGMM